MKRVASNVVVVVFFGLSLFLAFPACGDTGSCRVVEQGKVMSCTEVTGGQKALAKMKQLCSPGEAGYKTWVAASCPRENAISQCTVEKKDNFKQVGYCYQRIASISLEKALNICRKSCKGTFVPLSSAKSSNTSQAKTSPQEDKASGGAKSGTTGDTQFRECTGEWFTSEGFQRHAADICSIERGIPFSRSETPSLGTRSHCSSGSWSGLQTAGTPECLRK